MKFPQLIITTVENFKEITFFPFIQKSFKPETIAFDVIPIKYEGKNYFISLAFPYKYDQINLQTSSPHDDEPTNIYAINLIHQSDELNLSIFSCQDYSGIFYTLDDLKYKIPKDHFDEFKFLNNKEDKLININHIDYIFKNFDNDILPPFAYLLCQSETIYNGAILFNLLNKSIYGIVKKTLTKNDMLDTQLIIPSIAIKRLLDGIKVNFKYSNIFCEYELYSSKLVESGIKINNSLYDNIVPNEVISEIQDLKIINGNINYNQIDECVPIEVYMWYEWLPTTYMKINTYYKGTFATKNIQFVDYKELIKIPYSNQFEDTKIKRLTFRLIEYFIEKNIILNNESIDNAIMNPFTTPDIYLDISEELLNLRCEDLTHFPVNLVNI
jgi:hypothetical protein